MISADVLVYFYGNGNVGDDIFFDILVNRYKDVEFTVLLQSASAKNFFRMFSSPYGIHVITDFCLSDSLHAILITAASATMIPLCKIPMIDKIVPL